MLFLHFRIGNDSFALSTEHVVEVVPLVELKTIRRAPEAISGSFEYRGRFVPVVDLCALELGRPARQRLSTRIIIVQPFESDDCLVGLIAENATEMLRLNSDDFAPFAPSTRGLVQRLDLESILSAPLQSFLRGDLVNSQ